MDANKSENSDAALPHILVVDDDVELCELLREYLEPEGFRIDVAYDGAEGLARAISGDFTLVVLDVMLPQIEGFEALRQIRQKSHLPVIMLTARGDDVDRIHGLEIGADDYLMKPFNPRELAARIQAVLRRSTVPDSSSLVPETIVLGDIELNKGARTVHRKNREIELTSVEFDLLAFFMKTPGHVVSRDDMVKAVLRRELVSFDRSIDVHVSNLRRKLGPAPDGGDRIRAIRGVGYLYVLPSKARSR
ncbi:MAG: response regulator transcription factor [Candidatus Acidiferrales bacterium]